MRYHRLGPSVPLLLVALATPVVRAQSPAAGRIEGIVTDSVHGRPAAGATVLLTRLSEPTGFQGAVADRDGHYRFDSLAAGRYSIAFATPYLDSLTVTMSPREVILGEARNARVDFATPSGATLRATVCPGIALGRDHGAVIGQVTDADTDRPLATARVVVSWNELAVDSATLQPVATPQRGIVPVDSLGHYRLCGVPTETYLMVQVQDSGHAGSVLTLTVDHEGGVLVRDLSLSVAASASIATLDSAAAAGVAP
ncbi:MAG: carboxypeptidase-like regulatory domain-containing protein, partial [bacterium]